MKMSTYIQAISCYLPEKVERNDQNSRLTRKTGIYGRHIVSDHECASDLAFYAAENLFIDSTCDRTDIDFVLLCTQSPDYFLPTTACLLQHRLGLSNKCGALDINLGCSGYIYGLSLAKGLIETGQAKKVLLLTAETYSKFIHPQDETVRPLFGDGATASLLVGLEDSLEGIHSFVFGTDGSGADKLIVPAGGARNPVTRTVQQTSCDEYGNVRTNYNLYMDGAGISSFALSVVPPMIDEILSKSSCSKQDVSYYVFHQANNFMLEFLRKKCGLMDSPFWINMENYGNTVSSSIPLAIIDMMKTEDAALLKKVVLAGFGVGLSWGGCMVDLSHLR